MTNDHFSRSADAPPCNLLLAEDDEASALYAEVVLRSCACAVTRVANGKQAVALVEGREFDLIFLDVHMPFMSGLTATRAIRALETERQRARTPIVIVTASAFPKEIEDCFAAGADAVLTKPFRVEQLLETVARWKRPVGL